MHWTEPRNFKEWFNRLISARSLVVGLLFLAIMTSELRFDWVEQILGSFLVSTNPMRPKSGAIWEVGKHTQAAHQTIEKIVTDRQAFYRETGDASSFKQIAETIQADEWVLVPPDLFRKLYLRLPPEVATEIIEPMDFLELINHSEWARTYFEKDGTGLNIYMLDKDNRVLKRLSISADLLYLMVHSDVIFNKKLDDFTIFENRIYTGDLFFEVLNGLDDDVKNGIIRRPAHILRLPGRIVRVGISDEAISGFIQIGFEVETGAQRRLVLVRGHEWAVWRLHSLLEGKKTIQ